MVFVCPILYVAWKVVKRTKFVKPEEADLAWERPIIDAYEANVERNIWLSVRNVR
jgi:yeast amino acid transporter